MADYTAVTTCSAAGWREYGQRMVESFAQYWPDDIKLQIYAEEPLPVPTLPMPEWLNEFKARHVKNEKAHGVTRSHRYDFRFDCVKFAHKVAAVTDAGSKLNDGVLIWIDADTITHAPVTKVWLDGLFPDGPYIAWLDRKFSFPECGFYMLRCSHRKHGKLMRKFAGVYQSDHVLSGAQTHDSYVLQQLINQWQALGSVAVHSLSGPVGCTTGHPLVNSPLAACFDHLKGPSRKTEGKSRTSDKLGPPRTEDYWVS